MLQITQQPNSSAIVCTRAQTRQLASINVSAGVTDSFMQQTPAFLVQILKEKLCDYYIRYWSECIKTFSKMDTYCLLKQRFGLENYISDVKKRAHRIIISKVRISNHIVLQISRR